MGIAKIEGINIDSNNNFYFKQFCTRCETERSQVEMVCSNCENQLFYYRDQNKNLKVVYTLKK